MSTVEAAAGKAQAMVRDSVKTVIAASMVGTAIEFYDFYAYGTAAANYFPKVFFGDTTNPTVALLASLLTFAIAFIARPLGSLVFGHFGDRMGRKTTLVVSLLTMGIATFLIGCLPTYNQWGVAAVAVLCLCRFVQGIGLGGEWSGAALVATENAPEDKRALYGSFPELGAPIGFFLSNGTYFLLETFNDNDAMLAWGWRVPFLLSSILVVVGLVVRVQMEETPIFRMAQEQKKVVKSPLTEVFKKSWKEVIQATFLVAVTYTLFYTLATWSLAWGTKTVEQGGGNLGFTNQEYLLMLMIAVCVFAAFIVISCVNADKFGRKRVIIISSCCLIAFALLFPFLLLAFPHRKQDGSLITESGQSNRRILDTSSANLPLSQIFHHILQIEYQVDADFCILTNAYICFTVYPSFHTDICIRCYAGSCEIRSIIAVIKLFVDIHISAHLDPDTFSIFFIKFTKIRHFILRDKLMSRIGFFHISYNLY